MSSRIALALLAPAIVFALALTRGSVAQGDASSSLPDAVKQGETLWKKQWTPGGKSCVECHGGGQNLMKAARLKSYPKFDKVLNRVVSAQQKLDQMIKDKAGGAPLGLGSPDLNALEAYISTLK